MQKVNLKPAANAKNIIQGDKYRITVLTPGLIRLEYDEEGQFEDRATQVVWNRDFAPTEFTVKETEEELKITTDRVYMIYNKKEFSSFGLSIQVRGNISAYQSIWHYGEEVNDLGGTARTLDCVNGACELEHGLMSRNGFSVLDDSTSLILREDGWVEPRKKGVKDIYFWGYGHDYLECLDAFYYLCGKTPMIPRYALGNWWSRYYEYTEESYMALVEQFHKEQIPFTVAVIDMDWHLVDIDPKYGSGWTGYTWNKELFPDPKRFLAWLHDNGMQVTLNVHPADGVRGHEDAYPEMAKVMGVDAEHEEPVNFDITDPKFMDAYFEILHHPLEEEGVDFWWLDWQQGSNCKMEGLDPLWMLNHYHYLDSARNGKRPMTFSRYAGPGSHRYPLGFSGDTHTTWDSLDFQPYFTNTASNIGYGWWSHDIGGHMFGYRNDEMMVRWLQYGVFSPINRLHSTKDDFWKKEPWEYGLEKRQVMDDFLRLRHKLLPYLYTMNYRAYKDNQPLIWPMYYTHPEEEEAYQRKNQYWFGSAFMVAPITSPNLDPINMGKVDVWLPEGTYIDFFTNMIYRGGRTLTMYRYMDSIPVLAKAGAIVPMTEEIFGTDAVKNPTSLVLNVYAGADGSFTLYEDDNVSEAYKENHCVKTEYTFNWEKEKSFVIHPAQGELDLVPEKRDYTVRICGCTKAEVSCRRNGMAADAEVSYCGDTHQLVIVLKEVAVTEEVVLEFSEELALAQNDVTERVFDLMKKAEVEFKTKREVYELVCKGKDAGMTIGQLMVMDLNEDLRKAVIEIITA
ncbi:MAG: TIM-barrel domain-containing protein [Muricoprocola sp.]